MGSEPRYAWAVDDDFIVDMSKTEIIEGEECGQEVADTLAELNALNDQLAAAQAENKRMKGFISWLWHEEVHSDFELDSGAIQDEMERCGFIEEKPAEPDSPEAEEWGEGAPMYYLKPEYEISEEAERALAGEP